MDYKFGSGYFQMVNPKERVLANLISLMNFSKLVCFLKLDAKSNVLFSPDFNS
jgi:hypothetical protein